MANQNLNMNSSIATYFFRKIFSFSIITITWHSEILAEHKVTDKKLQLTRITEILVSIFLQSKLLVIDGTCDFRGRQINVGSMLRV